MGISHTDTGSLDDYRKGQLRAQVAQHTDDQLPPLHLPGMAEEVIKAASSGAPEVPAKQLRLKEPGLTPQVANNDNKFADVLSAEPQKVPPLSQNLRNGIEDPNAHQTKPHAKRQLIPQFA